MKITFELDKDDEMLRPVLREAVKKLYTIAANDAPMERKLRLKRICKTLSEKFLLDFIITKERFVIASIPIVSRLTH